LRIKAAGINAVMNHDNSLLGNPVYFDEFFFQLIANDNNFAPSVIPDLQIFDAHDQMMVEAHRVPELSDKTAVAFHLFKQDFARATAASKNILGKDAVKTHHYIAILFSDDFGSKHGKDQNSRASRPPDAGHTMAPYPLRNRNAKLLAE
jgi:hypothetical protein